MNDNHICWGIDIGGANLKLATADGMAESMPFAMWTNWNELGKSVIALRDRFSAVWDRNSNMAITMTGEMADCFESRRIGVSAILDNLTQALPSNQCSVYGIGGQWLSIQKAKEAPWSVASSNWYALAQWCLQQSDWGAAEWSAIVDIGSTTVDIIPVSGGAIATQAATDRQRLELGQLVYTGMERTPAFAIIQKAWVDGKSCPVMAERFATISDAYLVLGAVEEEPDCLDSADGRPRTRQFALARLARMVGEDAETLREHHIIQLANQIVDAQAAMVGRQLLRNLPRKIHLDFNGTKVFVTGHGKALMQRVCRNRRLNGLKIDYLDHYVSSTAARCAPALAVAQLYQSERCRARREKILTSAEQDIDHRSS